MPLRVLDDDLGRGGACKSRLVGLLQARKAHGRPWPVRGAVFDKLLGRFGTNLPGDIGPGCARPRCGTAAW